MMDNQIIIRKARKEDIDSINQLSMEMHRYLARSVGIEFSDKDLEEEKINPSELKNILVAEVDGIVVGYVVFEEEEDEWYGRHLYLGEIAVTDTYRGKGIGERLMQRLFDICEKKKLNLKVDTLVTNTRTIDFYKKLGFKPFMIHYIKEYEKRLKL